MIQIAVYTVGLLLEKFVVLIDIIFIGYGQPYLLGRTESSLPTNKRGLDTFSTIYVVAINE